MLIKNNYHIILASTSVVRKEILKSCNLDFEVIKPLYDEDGEKPFLPKMSPKKMAIFLASKKALSISEKYPESYVIGADQVCEFMKKDISKSQNINEAIKQLTKFNGRNHYQNNGLVVAHKGKIIFTNFARVRLKMRKLSEKQIIDYVNCDQSFGCAGSYKYESLGKHLFERVEGDYYAILGLAIQPLLNFLHSKKIINF